MRKERSSVLRFKNFFGYVFAYHGSLKFVSRISQFKSIFFLLHMQKRKEDSQSPQLAWVSSLSYTQSSMLEREREINNMYIKNMLFLFVSSFCFPAPFLPHFSH